MSETRIGYWFCCEDERGYYSPLRPRQKWQVWDKHSVRGEIALCRNGFHASPTAWQALEHALGPVLCKVEISGEIVGETDKFVGRTKLLVAAVNVERELRLLAADYAARDAAWAVAWAAAVSAAWSAARAAAKAVAEAATSAAGAVAGAAERQWQEQRFNVLVASRLEVTA